MQRKRGRGTGAVQPVFSSAGGARRGIKIEADAEAEAMFKAVNRDFSYVYGITMVFLTRRVRLRTLVVGGCCELNTTAHELLAEIGNEIGDR